MVSIPFTTQLITNNDLYQHGATPLYVAVLLVSSISLAPARPPRSAAPGAAARQSRRSRTGWPGPSRWTTPAVLALVLVIVVIFPSVGAWPMLLLFVDGFVERRLAQRRAVAKG